MSSNESETNLTTAGSDILGVDWSDDGAYFAYGQKDHDIFINQGATASVFNSINASFTEPGDDVFSVDFSPDSQYMVAAIKNNDVFVYKNCNPPVFPNITTPIHNNQFCPA